mmetsp:Transcript_18513/g.23942  ORF Transcript_18513/g.23942 Transcript_18513/m.23942 type:complete len:554 (+) Transcript_18513:67-1728(+)
MPANREMGIFFTLGMIFFMCFISPVASFFNTPNSFTSPLKKGHHVQYRINSRKNLVQRFLSPEDLKNYLELRQDIKITEQKLQAAQQQENFDLVLSLYEKLDKLSKKDPVVGLERKIVNAINRGDWEEAVRLREVKEALQYGVEGNFRINRLCVMASQGSNIVTCKGDGQDVRFLFDQDTLARLTESGQLQQPTWSPDGEKIAFTTMRINRGAIEEARLVVYSESLKREIYNTPFKNPPFYMQWSRDNRVVTFLSQGEDGNVQMVAVDSDARNDPNTRGAVIVDKGTPLFFSTTKGPSPSRYLIHNGSKRTVTRMDATTGESSLICLTSGSMFMAPSAHTRGGQDGVVVVEKGHLTSIHADGRENPTSKRLVPVKGFSTFIVSPDEQKIALMQQDLITGFYSISMVSANDDALDPESKAVVENRELPMDNICLAFFWSPDSKKLLTLATNFSKDELALARNSLKQGYNLKCRWTVYDTETGETKPYAEFVPRSFYIKVYLPFFDQYAQSYTPWSPDSQQFAYVSNEGCFVQDIDEEDPWSIASQAEIATWSWC